MTTQDLPAFRVEIDAIDDEIVRLLGLRFEIAANVAAYKRKHDIAVRLQDRIDEVLNRVSNIAPNMGADADAVRTIYETIIETTCRYEETKIATSA